MESVSVSIYRTLLRRMKAIRVPAFLLRTSLNNAGVDLTFLEQQDHLNVRDCTSPLRTEWLNSPPSKLNEAFAAQKNLALRELELKQFSNIKDMLEIGRTLEAEESADLLKGCSMVASALTFVDYHEYYLTLCKQVEELERRKPADFPETLPNSLAGLQRFVEFFTNTLQFKGASYDKYFEFHETSRLDHLIETKEGLPITLSVLFMVLLSRSCPGISVRGINFPKNFIVRVDFDDDHFVYVDCFEHCKIYTEELLKRHPVIKSTPRLKKQMHLALAETSTKEIWQRMMRNIAFYDLMRNNSLSAMYWCFLINSLGGNTETEKTIYSRITNGSNLDDDLQQILSSK